MRRLFALTALMASVTLCLAAMFVARAEGSAFTDVETVTRYLESEPRTWELDKADVGKPVQTSVRILSDEEAAAVVDEVFRKREYFPCGRDDTNYPRLKRLIQDGLVVSFAYDVKADPDVRFVWRGCKDPNEYRATEITGPFTGYGFWLRTFDSDVRTVWHCACGGTCVHPRVCRGFELVRMKRYTHGTSWTRRSEFDVLPFRVDRRELAVCATNSPAREAVVVADVEDVALDALVNLNASWISPSDGESAEEPRFPKSRGKKQRVIPGASYRVDLLVRKVLEGHVALDRVVCRVNPADVPYRQLYEEWPFFRGMTLRVELSRQGDALCVSRVDPVLPYPPYTPATCGEMDVAKSVVWRRFCANPAICREPSNAVASVTVAYGDHTLARFYSTVNDVTGVFGTYPDYSRTCAVEVWTAREGADPVYWHESWFSDNMGSMRMPRVSVRDVEKALGPNGRLAFDWHGLRFPEEVRQKARAMGDVLDELEHAAVCRHCGRKHYRFDAGPDVRRRFVDLSPDAPSGEKKDRLGALETLQLACSLSGCTYTVGGGVITVVPEYEAADFMVSSLEGRLRVLERDGFANVAGADYADVDAMGFWFGGDCTQKAILSFTTKDDFCQTSGNTWTSKAEDGTARHLMFDSAWWPHVDEKGAELFRDRGKARPLRDCAVMRIRLRDAPGTQVCDEAARENDMAALAHALHLLQLGYGQQAQELYDALGRRPFAARVAFAGLRMRVKRGKRCPDVSVWLKGDAEVPEKVDLVDDIDTQLRRFEAEPADEEEQNVEDDVYEF